MGFQIVSNISKIKKILKTDWPNGFCHKAFVRITKATMMRHLTRKKVHIDGLIFFKIHIADLFQSTIQQA